MLILFTALQAGEPLQSGPAKGKDVASFAPHNLNGKRKDSYHCLVCEYSLGSVVLIFAREPGKDKDQGLNDILKKLDKAVDEYTRQDFHAFVVFLSPDASSSANDPKLANPAKLVAEAAARDKLIARLKPRVDDLKNVVACIYPTPGPKAYTLSDKADVTLLFYSNYKVLANAAFKEGEFQLKDAEAFMKIVTDTLDKEKKKPASKKKK